MAKLKNNRPHTNITQCKTCCGVGYIENPANQYLDCDSSLDNIPCPDCNKNTNHINLDDGTIVPNVFGFDDLTDPQPKKSAKKKTKYKRCDTCLGNGFIEDPDNYPGYADEDEMEYVTCPTCKGKKKLPVKTNTKKKTTSAKTNTKKKTTSAKSKRPKRITCPKCEGLTYIHNPHFLSELEKHRSINDLSYIPCSKCQGNGRITVINKKKRKKPSTKLTKKVEKEEELPSDNPFKFIKLD